MAKNLQSSWTGNFPYAVTKNFGAQATFAPNLKSPATFKSGGIQKLWVSGWLTDADVTDYTGSGSHGTIPGKDKIWVMNLINDTWSAPSLAFQKIGYHVYDPNIIGLSGSVFMFYTAITNANIDLTDITKHVVGLAKSTDGGVTWVDSGIVIPQANGLNSDGAKGPSVVTDAGLTGTTSTELWIYYEGNTSGLYRTRMNLAGTSIIATQACTIPATVHNVDVALQFDGQFPYRYALVANSTSLSSIVRYVSADGLAWVQHTFEGTNPIRTAAALGVNGDALLTPALWVQSNGLNYRLFYVYDSSGVGTAATQIWRSDLQTVSNLVLQQYTVVSTPGSATDLFSSTTSDPRATTATTATISSGLSGQDVVHAEGPVTQTNINTGTQQTSDTESGIVNPTAASTTVTGTSGAALNTPVDISVSPPGSQGSQANSPQGLIVDTIIDATTTGTSVFVGERRASEIAQAIGTSVGIPVQWATDDYTLFEGFDRSGDSAEDAIRDLAKPMMLERRVGASVFEPFTTDFYVANGVAVVKKRQGITATPEYTLTVDNIGAASIKVVKTRLPIWGKVTLVGRATSAAVRPGAPGGGGGTNPPPIPNPTTPPGTGAGDQGQTLSGTDVTTTSTTETKNTKDGSITQTIVQRVYIMPDNLPRQIRTTKYVSDKNGAGLILSSTRLQAYDYLHFGYDSRGPRAHAKVLQKFDEITSRVNETAGTPAAGGSPGTPGTPGNLRVTSYEWTTYGWDINLYLRAEGTLKFKLGKTQQVPSPAPNVTGPTITATPDTERTWTVIQNEDVGLAYTAKTTDQYTFVPYKTTGPGSTPTTNPDSGLWEHTGSGHSLEGGKAPGGPSPGAHQKVTALPTAQMPGGFQIVPTNQNLTGGHTISDERTGQGVQRETLQAVISTDPAAQVYSYSNPNLTLAELNRIMNQMRSSSGLFQYEVEVKGPDASFLRRGQYVQINGARSSSGGAIPLDPMIITSFERKFSERTGSSMTFKGRFWRITDIVISGGSGGNPDTGGGAPPPPGVPPPPPPPVIPPPTPPPPPPTPPPGTHNHTWSIVDIYPGHVNTTAGNVLYDGAEKYYFTYMAWDAGTMTGTWSSLLVPAGATPATPVNGYTGYLESGTDYYSWTTAGMHYHGFALFDPSNQLHVFEVTNPTASVIAPRSVTTIGWENTVTLTGIMYVYSSAGALLSTTPMPLPATYAQPNGTIRVVVREERPLITHPIMLQVGAFGGTNLDQAGARVWLTDSVIDSHAAEGIVYRTDPDGPLSSLFTHWGAPHTAAVAHSFGAAATYAPNLYASCIFSTTMLVGGWLTDADVTDFIGFVGDEMTIVGADKIFKMSGSGLSWGAPTLTFDKIGYHVNDPSVVNVAGTLYMYYTALDNTSAKTAAFTNHVVGLAKSTNGGASWVDSGIVIPQSNGLNSDGAWSPSAVIISGDIWVYYHGNSPSIPVYRTKMDAAGTTIVTTQLLTLPSQAFNVDVQAQTNGIYNYTMVGNGASLSTVVRFASTDGSTWVAIGAPHPLYTSSALSLSGSLLTPFLVASAAGCRVYVGNDPAGGVTTSTRILMIE